MNYPYMPKSTALWLVENTSLSFEQISEFCGLHELEVKNIADAEVNKIQGLNPILNGQLTKEEIKKASALSEEAGAHFVKTSTGFSTGGATVEDVKLMKESVSDKMKIKASGGIRTKEFAEELLAAGADRLGVGNGLLLL